LANEIVQGDNGTILSLTVVDDKGNVVDLRTATSVELAIKYSRGMPTIKQGTITDGQNGKVQVVLNDTDTANEGIFAIQCTVNFIDGEKFNSDIQKLIINNNLRN
jgi:hypothetical protein